MTRFELSHTASARRVSIRIDLAALRDNLDCARRCCAGSKIFSVLKADAYGHGAVQCAQALCAGGSDGLAVVFPGEAEALRDAGISVPILVLQGPASVAELRMLAARDLWAVIHDISQLKLLETATGEGLLKVWLKVDTGMGRMGVSIDQLPSVWATLTRQRHLQCMGVLSHLACADEPGNQHTQQQIARFSQLESSAISSAARPVSAIARSLANSAAVLAWPAAHFDWVRPGIMLYGANPLLRHSAGQPLQPVMQVSAPLTALKFHRRGDGIGYSQCYSCPEDMPVGYAAIGYGDGLPRVLKGATVVLHGKPVPIIGRVSMDSIALDLRGLEASVGDQVIIWGKGAPVENLASCANTISYELLCSIRGRRVFEPHLPRKTDPQSLQ